MSDWLGSARDLCQCPGAGRTYLRAVGMTANKETAARTGRYTQGGTMGKGLLFVLSAPSGAGKSTLIGRIRPLFPDMLYSISCTTRPPRDGEVNGAHYWFLDAGQFRGMIDRNEFLEWKEVHGNLYGTPVGPVREAIDRGQRMILDIDVQGAAEVFRNFHAAVGIFINAPSLGILEERLRARGTDSEESIRLRLRNASKEMESVGLFRYVVVNDDLEAATRRLASIVSEESELHARTSPAISR